VPVCILPVSLTNSVFEQLIILVYMYAMPAHCTTRSGVFTFSAFVGGAVSAVIFRYRFSEMLLYFDLPILHKLLFLFLVLAYVLPTLVLYILFYLSNRFFIHLFDSTELGEMRKRIFRSLIDASIHQQSVHAKPADLTEETAWTSTNKYWRPE
jgi:hypothetical protein